MKRTLLLCLVFAVLLSLVACNATGNTLQEGEDAYFLAKVIALYEKGCLVEVTDAGNQSFSLGERISVSTNIENCPEYDVGDHIEIIFDGTVAESYPPQILHVIEINKAPG